MTDKLPQPRDNPWLTGMTLRDVAALHCLSAMIASGEWSWTASPTDQAASIWEIADALVATREL